MAIDGKEVLVDIASYRMRDGDQAVVVSWDGVIKITNPTNLGKGRTFAGVRSGLEPAVGSFRAGCVIVGRVVDLGAG
jgi:hypothetical protein